MIRLALSDISMLGLDAEDMLGLVDILTIKTNNEKTSSVIIEGWIAWLSSWEENKTVYYFIVVLSFLYGYCTRCYDETKQVVNITSPDFG